MAKVFIAVGHGTQTNGVWDSGAVDGNWQEADVAFPIVGFAIPVLRNAGVEVETDWDTGNDRNMTYTVRDSNAMDADVYVSVHIDWNQAASGIYPLVASVAGEQLANCIKNAMEARMDINFRGIAYSEDYEVTATNAVACIFEEGGIRSDINSLINEAKVRGESLGYGILDYLGIQHAVGTNTQPQPIPSTPSASGSTDDGLWDVEYRQYFLHICNYQFGLDIDNEEGPITIEGYTNAQSSYGIDADGEWGPITQGKAKGQVLAYQIRLKELGFYSGDLDGIPGELTLQAVKDFQASRGLDIDGCIGENTFAALMN
ncbi:peptidoglycan-binding protein [Acetobacterium sp.]|uniref:peptidoglycan-binding protein n=1 Tax=Acetobacterium sp. TaxID=1872094 RepID=UPI002F3F0C23